MRVSALAGLEHGVLSIGGTTAAIVVLATGRTAPPLDFTLPWAVTRVSIGRMVFTRRTVPLAGAAIAGIFAYRILSLLLPMPVSLAALPRMREMGEHSTSYAPGRAEQPSDEPALKGDDRHQRPRRRVAAPGMTVSPAQALPYISVRFRTGLVVS